MKNIGLEVNGGGNNTFGKVEIDIDGTDENKGVVLNNTSDNKFHELSVSISSEKKAIIKATELLLKINDETKNPTTDDTLKNEILVRLDEIKNSKNPTTILQRLKQIAALIKIWSDLSSDDVLAALHNLKTMIFGG